MEKDEVGGDEVGLQYEGDPDPDPDPAVVIIFSSDDDIHNILGLPTSPLPQGGCLMSYVLSMAWPLQGEVCSDWF